MKPLWTFVAAAIALIPSIVGAQAPPKPQRTILAIGAHAGDMELTCGALLSKAARKGDRVVILHLTLGERGNPKLDSAAYGEQKKREAGVVAAMLGAEARFGPYRDGELPDSDAARLYVAGVIRDVQPSIVITHWQKSMHRDHAATSAVVKDAVLLASLDGVLPQQPLWRGVRAVWYAENWEDAEDFKPYVYVDVSGEIPQWREAVAKYEFVGGSISSFRYLDYYTALATVRGAEARKAQAIAFDVESYAKRRVLDDIP